VSEVVRDITNTLNTKGCWSCDDIKTPNTRCVTFLDVLELLHKGGLDNIPELLISIQQPNRLLAVIRRIGLFSPADAKACKSCTKRTARFLTIRAARHAINYVRRQEAADTLPPFFAHVRECWNIPAEVRIIIPYRDMSSNICTIEERL